MRNCVERGFWYGHGMRLDNRRYYDEFSVSYERHRHAGYHAFIDDLESSLVRRYVTANSTVLEAGCGTWLVLGRIAPARQTGDRRRFIGGMLGKRTSANYRLCRAR